MRRAGFVVAVVAVVAGVGAGAGAPRAYAQANKPAAGAAAAAPEQAQVDIAKLSKPPKQKKFVDAEYPKEAFEKNIEADVVLVLDIDAQGKVTSVGVAEPADPPGMGFDEAAMLAAQGFEFEPAEIDGKPVAIQLTYKYKFRITKKPEAPAPAAPAPAAGTPSAAAPAAPAKPAREPIANFTGQLRERGTRLPMAGVLVTIFREKDGKPEGYEATSDTSGAFVFYDLGPGEWKVLIEAPGYYPFRTTEEIRTGEGTNVVYYVERGSYNPFDVTVTATRPKKEVSRTVIAAKEISKIPGTSGDALAVVTNFTGVARAPTFSGLIIVRGSAPEDTRIFVDGVDVPIIYHFGGLRTVVPLDMLEAIDFYPGNFSSQYGRATGGIIDVGTKKRKPPRLGGSIDVSILDTGIFLEAPLGEKGSIAIAGRRSYVDAIINAAVPDDAPVNVITAPRYYDYQLLGTYRPTAAHELRLFAFGSDDRLEFLFRNPSFDAQLTSNQLGASSTFYRTMLSWKYVPSDRFENTLRLSEGRNWLFFGLGNIVFDFNLYTSQVRDNVRQKLTDRLHLNYGLDFMFWRYDILVRAPRPPKEGDPPMGFDLSDSFTTELNDQNVWSPAAFLELEWKPFDRLLLLPGVRVDAYSRTKTVAPQPRFVGRLQLTKTWTAKGGVGLFTMEPDPEETDPAFGNPDLKPERALHYSAGVEWRPREGLTIDVTGFYKDMWDLVSKTDRLVERGGERRPLVYDNGGAGRVLGLELLVRKELTDKLMGWIAYTLSRSQRRDSGSDELRLFDFDQPHILTILGSYRLPRNWLVGARYRLVSGNPRTPIVGGVFNASADRYEPVAGAVNSARNAPFHQLDLRLDKQWIYERWMLTLYLDIQNVYNRANSEGLNYNFDYTESEPQQGLPLLTILGIRADF